MLRLKSKNEKGTLRIKLDAFPLLEFSRSGSLVVSVNTVHESTYLVLI